MQITPEKLLKYTGKFVGWAGFVGSGVGIGVGSWQLSIYINKVETVDIYTINNNTCLGTVL